MARRHGSYGQMKMDPTGGATAVLVASLNAWTLDLSRDTVDVTAFGDLNKQYVLGLPDIKGTYGGWWDAAESKKLFDLALGVVAPLIELYPSSQDPTYYFKGHGYTDASINVTATGAVALSGNFVASDNWVFMPTP
jgi:hypothetical protein